MPPNNPEHTWIVNSNGPIKVLELGVGLHVNPFNTSDGRGVIMTLHDATKHSKHVDVMWDLENAPWACFADCSYDVIRALDVFEHLRLPIPNWLGECWRILRPDGSLVFRVPETGSWHAEADPTHVRGFHAITFDYFCPGTESWERYGRGYTHLCCHDKVWERVAVQRSEPMPDPSARTRVGYDLTFVLRKKERTV